MLVKQNSAKNRWRDKAETVEKKIEMNRVGISGICPWLFSTEQTKTEGFDSLSLSLLFPSLSCNLEISISSRSSRYFNEDDIPCRRCRKDTGPSYVHQRPRVQQASEGWNDRPCVEGTKIEATVGGGDSVVERVYAISGLIWPIKKSQETRAQVRWILESVDGIR